MRYVCQLALVVLSLVSSAALQAQSVAFEFVHRSTDLWDANSGIYNMTLRVQNRTGYTPGLIVGVNAITITGPALNTCPGDCQLRVPDAMRLVGPIDTRDFATGDEPWVGPMRFVGLAGWEYSDTYRGNPLSTKFGPGTDSPFSNMGIIGCTVPDAGTIMDQFVHPNIYSGRNCIEDGFDGWFEFDFVFGAWVFGDFPPIETVIDQFSATAHVRTATFDPIVTPEPGTMVLLGAGLVGIAVVARRRRVS